MSLKEGYATAAGWVSFTKKWHNKPYPFISPERPELSAAGKNVVITGGASGIGKATAIAFAQAGAASVAIIGRRLERLKSAVVDIQAAGRTTVVVYEAADIGERANFEKAMRNISDKVGKIHVFVANAGATPSLSPTYGHSEEVFRSTMDTNIMGAFNSIQAFIPLAAPGAKLFNISSGIGHISPMTGVVAYATSKAAAIKLFDYVAAENPDIHVVNIQPGVIETELQKAHGVPTQDEPELPGNFLVWLSSAEAKFLKGKYVWVNWDAEELISRASEIEGSKVLEVILAGVPM